MLNRNYLSLFVLAASLAVIQPSSADTTPAAGTSEAKSEPSLLETIGKNIGVNYFGVVQGPALSEPTSKTKNLYSSSSDGSPTPMNIYNELRLDYKTGKRFNVRLNHRFEIYPLTDSSRSSDSSGFILSNVRYGIVGLIVDPNSGGFSMATSMALELPTSQVAQSQQMLVAPRITLNPNVDLPNTRWSLGAYVTGETFFYLANNRANRDLFFYVGPYANYRISDSVQATFQYEAATNHMASGLYSPSATDIQLGVNWDISKKLSVNPFVQVHPDSIQLRNMFVGANISATLL